MTGADPTFSGRSPSRAVIAGRRLAVGADVLRHPLVVYGEHDPRHHTKLSLRGFAPAAHVTQTLDLSVARALLVRSMPSGSRPSAPRDDLASASAARHRHGRYRGTVGLLMRSDAEPSAARQSDGLLREAGADSRVWRR
jgi:hypothetical protein